MMFKHSKGITIFRLCNTPVLFQLPPYSSLKFLKFYVLVVILQHMQQFIVEFFLEKDMQGEHEPAFNRLIYSRAVMF